ncbi:sensor histidine kinase [Paenibacillus crassostreae]|uniref:Histidine kinase n=1 Tax=Paenibacillus crassostreae TaxID=1763538 RepID=A0A167B952_9BACL|nr:sensor histidine kinase [Paenibacillus crassostreae]AOZ93062.1 sensor histidine kinase [Paenibacillus crassostreae]OAB71849.1 histidine kinase [Paenibacillus crassostreae]
MKLPSLNNVRLRGKMLIIYFLGVFVPLLIISYIFYYTTTNNMKQQLIDDITRAIEQVKNEFAREVEGTMEISSVFYTDHLLNEIIDTKYEVPADYVAAYDSYLRRILNAYTPVYNAVAGITVYVDNPTLLFSGGVNVIDAYVKEKAWYQQVLNNRLSQPLIIRTGDDQNLDTFSVVRRMDAFYSQNQFHKILKIDMKMSSIRQIFSNLNLQGSVYLLNEKGDIEYTTDPAVNIQSGGVSFDTITSSADMIEFRTEYTMTNDLNGWSIVAMVSKDDVFKEVRQSRSFIILVTIINTLLPTFIIIWITRSLNVRIIRILKHMKRVKNQQFDTVPEDESRDEIGQLTEEFNRMTLQIKSLINDVYVTDIQKKDLEIQRRHSQLNALQSQINPHFLFNALETIRMRSVMKDEKETAHIIQNMAKIFRNSLIWKRDMITLKEELDFMHCFLEIQKYRFGDKLNYNIRTDESDYKFLIPKMSIVTFVENASIHGIEPLKSGGKIEVDIQRIRNELVVTIRDNGVGMEMEKIEHLYHYIREEEEMGDRIGIQNVIYRLKLYFGTRFELMIDSQPGVGTQITLKIPVEE